MCVVVVVLLSNWEFCSRMNFWRTTDIMANANFPFPYTSRKPETQTWGGGSIIKVLLYDEFLDLEPFLIFHDG